MIFKRISLEEKKYNYDDIDYISYNVKEECKKVLVPA
jgi:hypothetical protein